MSEEKILAGAGSSHLGDRTIAGGVGAGNDRESPVSGEGMTRQQRISLSTTKGGLPQLPLGFDAADGDWQVIHSDNPFEVLYLDYQLYKLIRPEVVTANYTILEKFWKDKSMMMNTGGNRIAFKNKFGEGTVEGSLQKLKRAYEKLNTAEGIERYYGEINSLRITKGETSLKDSIEHMMLDGCADRAEIQLCIDRGMKYGLTAEEAAFIVKKNLDAASFNPYGNVAGSAIIDQLFSVDSWMTKAKMEEAERVKKEREATRIQILPNRYAATIEEIGNILFEDPVEAKEIIREDLLKQVIAQKDVVLARTIGGLSKGKDLDIAYMSIVYKLNPTLPYDFGGRSAKTVPELCSLLFDNDKSLRQGKEQLRKGFIEIWLRETDTGAYQQFLYIRDNAENIDLALLQFLYTFNPTLPYRFAGSILVRTPGELCAAIDRNGTTWAAGVKELYDGWVIAWLTLMKQQTIVTAWNQAKESFRSQPDVGLEYFLHLLNKELQHPNVSASEMDISFPGIQSGQSATKDIVFSNTTRGFVAGSLSFTKPLPGVTLSTGIVSLNNANGLTQNLATLVVDSSVLLKGVAYETSIRLVTTGQQEIDIPVSFSVVFPRNAFWLEVAKYSLLIASFFMVTRLLITTKHADWLINDHSYYIDWGTAAENAGAFSVFGWSFFVLVMFVAGFIYFKRKYRLRK